MFHHPAASESNVSTVRSVPFRFFLVLVFLAILILFLGRTDTDTLSNLRTRTAETFVGIFGIFSGPVSAAKGWIDGLQDLALVYRENERLRAENQRLLEWKAHADKLQALLARYDALLNVRVEPGIEYVTARAVGDSGSPFVRTLVVNAGASDGVAKGQAVINHRGLVGWVVGVGRSASRVLLVNDLNSRIPVMIGAQAQRAILTGDNGPQPRLEFLMATGAVKPGDAVMTSGDGGVLPPGLPIGVVAGNDQLGGFRVSWHANDAPIDSVRILNYTFPTEVEILQDRPETPATAEATPQTTPEQR